MYLLAMLIWSTKTWTKQKMALPDEHQSRRGVPPDSSPPAAGGQQSVTVRTISGCDQKVYLSTTPKKVITAPKYTCRRAWVFWISQSILLNNSKLFIWPKTLLPLPNTYTKQLSCLSRYILQCHKSWSFKHSCAEVTFKKLA